jgi:hypothetical protein
MRSQVTHQRTGIHRYRSGAKQTKGAGYLLIVRNTESVLLLRDAAVMNPDEFADAHLATWRNKQPIVEHLMIDAAEFRAGQWDGDLHSNTIWT